MVLADVRRRLVSVQGARRYGVVIADGAVDAQATEKLRAQLVAQRGGEVPLFDHGGGIDEIKARCAAETGLPAPKAPVFRNPLRALHPEGAPPLCCK